MDIPFIKKMLVNNRIAPTGIDPGDILFSWHYEGPDSPQGFYQIVVYSGDRDQASENSIVWDSGKIQSMQHIYVPYSGSPLKYGRKYTWKIRLWTKSGISFESSGDDCFYTALKQEAWKAAWIWNDESGVNQFCYFRKKIMVRGGLKSAVIHLSAHNHFEFYVNGVKKGGYLSPAPSHPNKGKLYLTYDMTGLLVPGSNSLCAVVHYLGGDGQNYVNGKPGFILQGELIYEQGPPESIVSDGSWKASNQTAFGQHAPFQQNRRISAIESYNASKEPEGWINANYDDSQWDDAIIAGINQEDWRLEPQLIREGQAEAVYSPAPCNIQQSGTQVFDAGKIVTGWVRMTLRGIPGVSVRVRYSEDLDPNGRVRHNVCNETSENYYDEYAMKGEELETWEPRFSYKAFRYFELTGYPRMINPSELKVVCTHTELDYQGGFHCSDALLDKIFSACIQTQKNNVVGQVVDCPHREQAQYLADSDLQAETLLYNFYNPEVPEKVLHDFKDGQLQNGSFPFVFPSNVDCPDFSIKIPEWDLHYCTLLWKTYFHYGDKRLLKEYYPAAKKMADFYLGSVNETTGLLPKSQFWHISDWPYPNIDQEGNALTVQNIKLYNVLKTLVRIAEILQLGKDSHYYAEQAHQLSDAIVKNLYDPARKLFIDSYGVSNASQGTNAIAFASSLVPSGDKESVLDFLESKGFDCSTLLTLTLLRVLFENGRKDAAFKLLNHTDYPGWGYMIQSGYGTIWEGFQNIESHCHAWNAYPARLFVEYIVGIKAVSPGFRDVEIHPYISGALSFAEGRVPTPLGNLFVQWKKQDNVLHVYMETPPGINAKLVLDDQSIQTVVERDRMHV